MMTGGSGFSNYRKQRPSQMGPDVGAALQQRGGGTMPPGAGGGGPPMMGPDDADESGEGALPGAGGPEKMEPSMIGQGTVDGFNPETEHSATSTRLALSEAVGRAMGVRQPENPRIRSPLQRMQLTKLGLPPSEIQMLEANDPAIRPGG